MKTISKPILYVAPAVALCAALFYVFEPTSHLLSEEKLILKQEATAYQHLIIAFPHGASEIDRDKQGTLQILSEMFSKGPNNLSEYAYAQKLFQLNAQIDYSVQNKAFFVMIQSHPKKVKEVLKFFQSILENKKLDKQSFIQAKEIALNNRKANFESPKSVINYFAFNHLFNHSEYYDGQGSPATISAVTHADVLSAASKIDLDTATFFSLGPENKATIQKSIESVLTDKEKTLIKTKQSKISFYDTNKQQNILIHKENLTDNQLMLVAPLNIKSHTKEYFTIKIALNILGSFNGRLFKVLREERGLTYHASSRISVINADNAFWFIQTFGGVEQFPQLLSTIPEILSQLQSEGIQEAAFQNAKNILITKFKQNTELAIDRLMLLIDSSINHMPADLYKNYLPILESIQLEDVNHALRHSLNIKQMSIYAMGDKNKIYQAMPASTTVLPIEHVK